MAEEQILNNTLLNKIAHILGKVLPSTAAHMPSTAAHVQTRKSERKHEIHAVADVKLETASIAPSPMQEILYETTPTLGTFGYVGEQKAAKFTARLFGTTPVPIW
jgi:hypothetical protein